MSFSDIAYFITNTWGYHYLPKPHGVYNVINAVVRHRSKGGFVKTSAAGLAGWALNHATGLPTSMGIAAAYELTCRGQHLQQMHHYLAGTPVIAPAPPRTFIKDFINPMLNIVSNGININSAFSALAHPKLVRDGLLKELMVLNAENLKIILSSPLTWARNQNIASTLTSATLPGAYAIASMLYRHHQSYKAANELERRQYSIMAIGGGVSSKAKFLHSVIPCIIDLAIIDSMCGLNHLHASTILTSFVSKTLSNVPALVWTMPALWILDFGYKTYHYGFGITISNSFRPFVMTIGFFAALTISSAFIPVVTATNTLCYAATALHLVPTGWSHGLTNFIIPDFIKDFFSPDFSFRQQMSRLDVHTDSPIKKINAGLQDLESGLKASNFKMNLTRLTCLEKDIIWSCVPTTPAAAAAETMNHKLARVFAAAQAIYLQDKTHKSQKNLVTAVAAAVYLATNPVTPADRQRVTTAMAQITVAIKANKSLDGLLLNGGAALTLEQKIAILCTQLLKADNLKTTLAIEMGRPQYANGPAAENLAAGFIAPADYDTFITDMQGYSNAIAERGTFSRPDFQR